MTTDSSHMVTCALNRHLKSLCTLTFRPDLELPMAQSAFKFRRCVHPRNHALSCCNLRSWTIAVCMTRRRTAQASNIVFTFRDVATSQSMKKCKKVMRTTKARTSKRKGIKAINAEITAASKIKKRGDSKRIKATPEKNTSPGAFSGVSVESGLRARL